ncbi:MAG: hypothetical protein PHW73_13135, partial [Atribacterota bacterium]|nr:hypothetical protein [Atribacterota bacterium]
MSSRDRLPTTIQGQIVKVSEANVDFNANGIAKLRNALREELVSPRVMVNYGYGYRCWPYTNQRGKTVFTVAHSVAPPTNMLTCKVFIIENFTDVLQIGDLYALDSRNTSTGQPFITLYGSIIVPCWSVRYYDLKTPWFAIYRYSGGVWIKVYEDINGSYASHIGQDPVTFSLYLGYHDPKNFKGRVLKSSDDGVTWSVVYDAAETSNNDAITYSCAAYNNIVIATKRDKKTYVRSINGGLSWTESAVLPTPMRTVNIINDLDLSFITGDNNVYYSRDFFLTYKRIKIQSNGGDWVIRYPIRVGGRLLLDMVTGESVLVIASKDLLHTAVPVFSIDGAGAGASRISGYGDFLFVSSDLNGTLTRISLPKTLDKGFSNPIMLWENESETDLVNGSSTDYFESQYNDKKTFYIYSNQPGTLNIKVYDEVNANYKTIDTKAVAANTLVSYQTTFGARLMRLNFIPTVAATVSAW